MKEQLVKIKLKEIVETIIEINEDGKVLEPFVEIKTIEVLRTKDEE